MSVHLESIKEEDGKQIVDIFNHYIENSYAAYLENKVDGRFIPLLLGASKGYPAYTVHDGDRVLGFGMLRPFHPFPTFKRTAEVSYFVEPGSTGQGIGGLLLDRLTEDAKCMGIDTLLANISSRNEGSINFHKRHGFIDCGRFLGVGRKFGQDIDLVWMQKRI
ncbi:MAG: N-acetyltransferase family protein [Methanomassiliicoccus sp.]|nr:N-acetyltransferase family protein [Methanomassiliicoccus sp.]